MPLMSAQVASDNFLASHIGELLVRQPQPKASDVAVHTDVRRNSSITNVATNVANCTTNESSNDSLSQKLKGLSFSHARTPSERITSPRTSFSTNFGATPRRTSISNARCSTISSETTSYFDCKRRKSLHKSYGTRSNASLSPSVDENTIHWNLPFADSKPNAFAAAVQRTSNDSSATRSSSTDATAALAKDDDVSHAPRHKSEPFSDPFTPTQDLEPTTSPKLEDQPMLSPLTSIGDFPHAGSSALSNKSGSSLRSFRRAPSLVPKTDDGRTFTFVDPLTDSDLSDDNASSPPSPLPSDPVASPTARSPTPPTSTTVEPVSPANAQPRSEKHRSSASSLPEKDDASRSSRTVTFAPASPAAHTHAALASPPARSRTGRPRQMVILPRDTQKVTLLERTLAKERTVSRTFVDDIVRRNDRARTKSPAEVVDVITSGSDCRYGPIESAAGEERNYRLRSSKNGSDEETDAQSPKLGANSDARERSHRPRANERTNDWAREQTRFSSPPLVPCKAVDMATTLSPDESDTLALPAAMTSLRPSGPRVPATSFDTSNTHSSSYTFSNSPQSSDMQDMRTPPSEAYTALSSPTYELDAQLNTDSVKATNLEHLSIANNSTAAAAA